MPRRTEVFISYRRDDTGEARSLYDALVKRFGRRAVFMDREAISPGASFPDRLRQALAAAKVVLVVIGKRWTGAGEGGGRGRIFDPNDWVALETRTALERLARSRESASGGAGNGEKAPAPLVIPLLVDGAALPEAADLPPALQPLREQQKFDISLDRYEYDLGRLIAEIDLHLRASRRRPPLLRPAMLAVAAAWFVATLVWAFQLVKVVPGLGSLDTALHSWLEQWADPGLDDDARSSVVLVLDDMHKRLPELRQLDAQLLDASNSQRKKLLKDRDLLLNSRTKSQRAEVRRDLARLIDALSAAEASVIGLDFVLKESTEADADEVLANSLRSSRRVVLAVDSQEDPCRDEKTAPQFPCALVDDRLGSVTMDAITGPPFSMLELARGNGETRNGMLEDLHLWPSLALRVVTEHFSSAESTPRPRYHAESGTLRWFGGPPEIPSSIPVERRYDQDGRPVYLFAFHLPQKEAVEEITLGRALDSPDELRDRIVVVGSTAELPLDGLAAPGPRVYAQIVAALLSHHYLRSAGPLAAAGGLLLMSAFGACWSLRASRPRSILESPSPYVHSLLSALDLALGVVLAALALLLVALVTFRGWRVALPLPYCMFAFAAAYLALAAVERRKVVRT